MNQKLINSIRTTGSIFSLIIGTIVSIVTIYAGWYLFAINIPLWEFMVGLPAIIIGVGFLLNNISSLIRYLGLEGKVGERLKDIN